MARRARKRCLSCGHVALEELFIWTCRRRLGFGNLSRYCGGTLQTVPRKKPQPRQQTPQETASRLSLRFRQKVDRLLRRVERDTAELRAAWKLMARYEDRARMTDEQVAAERAKRTAAAQKALASRAKTVRVLAPGGVK